MQIEPYSETELLRMFRSLKPEGKAVVFRQARYVSSDPDYVIPRFKLLPFEPKGNNGEKTEPRPPRDGSERCKQNDD